MARYCGGIKLNPTEFKLIDGVITLEDETAVSLDTAISVCGQLWDGEYFEVIYVDRRPCITIATEEGHELLNSAYVIHGNCGIGLDGRIFMLRDGEVSFIDGYTLTVIADPETANISVHDGEALIEPITPNGNQFFLNKVGEKYSITVQKDGYTGKSQTIENMGNQIIKVVLTEEPQS